jgi:dihydroneopterin aldolase
MSRIYLENVKIYAYHGVLPEENIVGTYYIVNAELHTTSGMQQILMI